MYATLRYYHGNTELADRLQQDADAITELISKTPGFRAYYLIRTDQGSVGVTVADDEEGTKRSSEIAAGYLKEKHPDFAASPPMISGGEVTVSA